MNETALILGAARQGQALARYMAGQGASVIVTDAKPYVQLSAAREALSDVDIEWVCGSHPLSLLDRVDRICVTAGADLRIPILSEALQRGIPVMNDCCIFFDRVTNPILAITGSSGKTTTTTLIGRIACAENKGKKETWIGGNIGLAMLSFMEQIAPADDVILELSSFQLELARKSPHIAAILNLTPNHLDRHGTMENYIAAKFNIMKYQTPEDIVVLSRDDANTWALRGKRAGKLFSFGFTEPISGESDAAVFIAEDEIRICQNGETRTLMPVSLVKLRGRHNLLNVMAACALAAASGYSDKSMRSGIEGFSGVEHRLQFVRNYKGADWYNDSIATAPERTLAAVHSFDAPLIMLLGGRDKKLPWMELVRELQTRARACILFGEAAPMIQAAFEAERREHGPAVVRCDTLEEAVNAAVEYVQSGDVVLLSPGGTSYDAFRDFEERGRLFTEWVLKLV